MRPKHGRLTLFVGVRYNTPGPDAYENFHKGEVLLVKPTHVVHEPVKNLTWSVEKHCWFVEKDEKDLAKPERIYFQGPFKYEEVEDGSSEDGAGTGSAANEAADGDQ